MIAAEGRFDLPFTCVDSTGAPVAPTGTPTGTLVKNGTDLGTTVTVTMATAQGIATCTIPSDAVNGDRFYLRISAVISSVTYVLSGPVSTVVNTVTLPTIPTDWITSVGIAGSAITEIQSGLASASALSTLQTTTDAVAGYVDTEVAAIKTVTDRLNTTLVLNGVVYQFTANALENAPASGGGSVIVYPLNASMPLKSVGLLMTFYTEEQGVVVGPIGVTARSGNTIVPVDLSGRTLEVRFIDYLGTELLAIPDADITISGADNDQFEFVVTTDLTDTPTICHEDQYHHWTLRDLTDGENVLLAGRARVLLS